MFLKKTNFFPPIFRTFPAAAGRDSLDWKDLAPETIINRVTTKVKPGSIVLFHNAAKNTPAALPKILEKLIADGYKIVPVSELIHKENFSVDVSGRQIPNTVSTGSID